MKKMEILPTRRLSHIILLEKWKLNKFCNFIYNSNFRAELQNVSHPIDERPRDLWYNKVFRMNNLKRRGVVKIEIELYQNLYREENGKIM